MYPHRIRLRGPWQCEPLAVAGDSVPLPPPCRMTMPCRWADGALAGFQGRVRFRRRFGYPGRIDAHERVWLTFGGASDRAALTLNAVVLGTHDPADMPFEYEVTALLGQRNELIVEVEGGANGGLWGEVALEVRCSAFLRKMRCDAAPVGEGFARIHVSGELAGGATDMLELYMVLDRSTVAYSVLPPPVAEHSFHLASEKLLLERLDSELNAVHRVRVDLVNIATVWYTWEQELTFEARNARHENS
jgi:hypothetical protein